MKSDPIKCIIKYYNTDTSQGISGEVKQSVDLGIFITGKYAADIIAALSRNKLATGSAMEITVDKVNTSKTVKQNNTFHDLLMIYWTSGYPSDQSYSDLKIRIKDTYGVRHEIHKIGGEDWRVLKSWSKYTLSEGRRAIDGLISEMLTIGVNDKRFRDMNEAWNDYKKSNPEKKKAESDVIRDDLF